ncbi:MAG: AAA-like domain-containing protein [Scytonema sp. PMC 1069.18]|nr:AAA-like domain-containing protein [Scytonema sp. PMC 1069.18]MEC4886229.1 AAA-like domain-containing protein [Scytonema sp. PMC 1070.18]
MKRNPFFVGQRVPPERFVGRKSELDAAFEQIQNRSHLAIWGGPGMGKSSFLDKIASPQVWEEHVLDPSQAVIVLFSCLNIAPFTACGFWKEVLSNMRDTLDSDPELQTEIEKLLETESITKDSLRQVLRFLERKDKFLVLLADDYDVALRENPQYTQADMLTFLSECRHLACHAREGKFVSMIVTSLQRLNELSPPLEQFTSPWYNHYLFLSLKPFTNSESQQLLSVLPQIPQALQNIIREISGGHPALLQNAGFLLYRQLRDTQEGQALDAKAFAKNFESDTRHIFQNIWARCSEEEQALLMLIALCGLNGRLYQQNYDLNLSGIERIFNQKERDLTSLEEQGVLVRTELPKHKDIKNLSEGAIIQTEKGEKKLLSFASSVMERWVIQELVNNINNASVEKRRKVFLNLMSKEQVDKVIKAMQWVWSHKDEINSTLEWFGKMSAASPKGTSQSLLKEHSQNTLTDINIDESRENEISTEEEIQNFQQLNQELLVPPRSLKFPFQYRDSASQYQVGGSLSLDNPTYVLRRADRELYEGMKAGEFCYVLNSLHMGKSSLLIQTMQRLQQEGIACTAIDLLTINSQNVSPEQWYAGFVGILVSKFELSQNFNLRDWLRDRNYLSHTQLLSQFFEEVLLVEISQPIVIFIDEIDSLLSLDFFKGNFFALIRNCYYQRVDKPEYRRLSFAVFGVATPSDLIQDRMRSSFDSGRAIQLNGFQLHEVSPLTRGLEGITNNPDAVLREILDWTGGQPFLTQKLCQMISTFDNFISTANEKEQIENLVRSQVIENWESQDNPQHLRTIRDRILSNEQYTSKLLGLYQEILKKGEIVADNSYNQAHLRLTGLVIEQQGKLRVFNRIYASIFNQSWVENELAKLRPYASAIAAWLASNCKDKSHLLDGQALHNALQWAEGKSLSDEDYQFLFASQALENQNTQKIEPETPAKTNTYRLAIRVSENQVTVGQHIHLQVELQPIISDQNIIEIPDATPEVYCFINADGLRVLNSEVLTIPVDLHTGHPPVASFELQSHLRGVRTYTIELCIENPESDKLSIFKHEGQITVNPPEAPQHSPPILPMLDIRVTAQPDFVLQVASDLPDGDNGAHHLTYYLTSRLRNLKLRNQKVGTVILQATQLQRVNFLLNKTLQRATNVQPEDMREQMISLGRYLFDILFPAETTADFRNLFWQVADKISTWLIMEEGITWLPWELVVPYSNEHPSQSQYFFCERYQLSHWIQGLGTPLYSEVPIGEIALTHYKEQQDEDVQAWERLLQAHGCSEIRQAVNPESPFYGLHLLRYSSELSRREIVARDEVTKVTSPEEEVPRERLNLWLKRPIVTLSVLTQENMVRNTNTSEWLLPERVLPFIKASASAVVGSWWQTSVAAERVFWSHFYELLFRRLPLGEIVWRSRLAVERALPHSPDWLAYTLFGNPRAKPYQPESSSGYSILECLNPDEPFYTGKTYYFRVSVRKRPPVWYQERLIQTEELPNELRALFMVPGLQTTFPEPVPMQPTSRNIRQATMSLTPEQEGDYPLVVQLLEGDELVKTLQLNMKVRGKVNG